ncbi:MAG: YqcI/YcgG family protein [Thiobacillus sp.]|nr:YqcI/YcgG family protein [Thiobacillus sp.]
MQACACPALSPSRTSDLAAQFKAFVSAADFPCVGAKSALSRGQMRFLIEDNMAQGPRAETLYALQQFSREYEADSPLFQSIVVVFRENAVWSEATFESRLWAYLQRLHDADSARYSWDPQVGKDPESAQFSFSIGGRGYYVVGLHPGASRVARRFGHPALVFNLHDQFERLRDRGTYGSLRDAIMARDVALEGDGNPMLKQFGTVSEARQYSGRAVEDGWTCPFHAR